MSKRLNLARNRPRCERGRPRLARGQQLLKATPFRDEFLALCARHGLSKERAQEMFFQTVYEARISEIRHDLRMLRALEEEFGGGLLEDFLSSPGHYRVAPEVRPFLRKSLISRLMVTFVTSSDSNRDAPHP
jgi:hypothetical protein